MNSFTLLLSFMLLVFVKLSEAAKINGRVVFPAGVKENIVGSIEVLLDGGAAKGFVKNDGTFTVHNIATGSYVLEVVSTKYMFEPVKIDISAKGNVRARKLNNLKPSQVQLVRYPLEMKPIMYMKYFQEREKFSVFDMLKSPMVLMMVLPLAMLLILPKLVNTNDPELKKEMEQSMNMFNPGQSQLPDMSEFMSNLFGGGQKKIKPKESKKSLKRK